MNKIIIAWFTFLLCSLAMTYAQEPAKHEKKVYVDESGKTYINKDLPVYINISTSPDDNARNYQLKSKETAEYANPMYFDTEGYNTIRSPWAIDKNTKKMVYPKREIIFEIYADSKAPKSRIDFSNTSTYKKNDILYVKGPFSLNILSKDVTAGVENIFISINKAAFSVFSEPVKLKPGNNYQIKYYAVDHVGNAEKVKEENIIIDNQTPVSQLKIKGDKHENIISNRSRIIINSKDSTGVKNIYYKIDDQTEKKYAYPILGKWFSEGEHAIQYYAVDNLNNKEKLKTFNFYVDKTPPTVIDEVLGDSYIANGKEFSSGRTKLKLTAFDNKAGIKEIYYSINNKDFTKYDKPVTLNITSGNINLETYAVDNVNNRTETSQQTSSSGIPYIDLTGPQISIAFSGPNSKSMGKTYINNQSKIILKGSDNEAGLSRIEYAIDDKEWQDYIKPFSVKEKGEHSIKINGFDNVDNLNQKSIKVFVDNEGPAIDYTFSTPPLENHNSKKYKTYPDHVVLFLSAIDKSSGFNQLYYSINDTRMKPYNDQIRYFKTNKKHKITIKATDKLGNSSSKEVSFFVSDN